VSVEPVDASPPPVGLEASGAAASGFDAFGAPLSGAAATAVEASAVEGAVDALLPDAPRVELAPPSPEVSAETARHVPSMHVRPP